MSDGARITQALARFEAALARFEQADGSQAAMEALRMEIAQLKQVQNEAVSRIDVAMAKIRQALEN